MFTSFSKRRECKYSVVVYVRVHNNLYTNYKKSFYFLSPFGFLYRLLSFEAIFFTSLLHVLFDFTSLGLYLVLNNLLLWKLLLQVETAFFKYYFVVVLKQAAAGLRAVHNANITAFQYVKPVTAAAPSALRLTTTNDRAIPVSGPLYCVSHYADLIILERRNVNNCLRQNTGTNTL